MSRRNWGGAFSAFAAPPIRAMPSQRTVAAPAATPTTRCRPCRPIAVWVHIALPEQGDVVAFTYIDKQTGFSATGFPVEEGVPDKSVGIIVRLSVPWVSWRRLTDEEMQALELETPPSWVEEIYGPQ